MRIVWALVLILVGFATVATLNDIANAQSAPQQAAAAAMGLVGVIAPYVLARCLEKIFARDTRQVEVVNWPPSA